MPDDSTPKRRSLWSYFTGRAGNRLLYSIGACTLLAAVGAYWARPRAAKTTIVVTGTGNKALTRFSLEIDGRQYCSVSPCMLSLDPGMHELRARSDGYSQYEQRIAVTPGSEVLLHVMLSTVSDRTDSGFAAATVTRKPIEGSAAAGNIDVAKPAPEVKGGTPDMVPITRGQSAMTPANGAGDSRATANGAGDSRATANGAGDSRLPTSSLRESRASARPSRTGTSARNRHGNTETPAPEPSDGTCTLNLNSIPASNVLVDGRPYGSTPKVGVPVPAGKHSVVFVQSEGSRESQTISCAPGESRTVAVQFRTDEST